MNIAYKCIKLYNINILILKGGYDARFLKLLGALLTVIITFGISILFSFLIPLMVEGNILNMGKLNQPTFIMLWIIFSVIFNIIILILAFSMIQFSSDFVNKMKLMATLTFL